MRSLTSLRVSCLFLAASIVACGGDQGGAGASDAGGDAPAASDGGYTGDDVLARDGGGGDAAAHGGQDGGEDSGDDGGDAGQSGGTVVTLASGQKGPLALTLDAQSLYWINGDNSVWKVALSGGAPVELTQSYSMGFDRSGIAVDSQSVYWDDNLGAQLMKVPIAGGMPTVVNAEYLQRDDLVIDSSQSNLYDVSVGGVAVEPAAGGTSTLFEMGGAAPLAIDAQNLYFIANGNANIAKAQLPNGAVTMLATVASVIGPGGIAVDATSVYWSEPIAGAIMKVDIAGGAATTLASGLQKEGPGDVATDGTNVYWVTGHSVRKVSVAGGNPQTLVSGQGGNRIAVDATSVYWIDEFGGTVMKVSPK
jgi:hypothetical protein